MPTFYSNASATLMYALYSGLGARRLLYLYENSSASDVGHECVSKNSNRGLLMASHEVFALW